MEHYREFGRLVEVEIFGGQVLWWDSSDVSDDYICGFVSAIELGTKLPQLTADDKPSYKIGKAAIFGLDTENEGMDGGMC